MNTGSTQGTIGPGGLGDEIERGGRQENKESASSQPLYLLLLNYKMLMRFCRSVIQLCFIVTGKFCKQTGREEVFRHVENSKNYILTGARFYSMP